MRIQHLLALAIAAGGTLQAQAIELNEQYALAITPALLADEDAQVLGRPLGSGGFRLEYSFFDAGLAPLAVGCFLAPEDQLKLTAEIGITQA